MDLADFDDAWLPDLVARVGGVIRFRRNSNPASCLFGDNRTKRIASLPALLLLAGVLVSCAGPPPAPVEDRGVQPGSHQATPDGHYRVRRGDSLHAIAFKFGLDWREIARLNGISSPYTIYPDQVLRLTSASPGVAVDPRENPSSARVSPASSPATTTTHTIETPKSSTRTIGEPAPTVSGDRSAKPPQETAAPVPPAEAAVRGTQAPAGSNYSAPAGDPDRWLWPTKGKLLSRFRADDPSRKGIDIGGKAGQPVVATAAGQVVYSGSGLIGYGELIIIKHSDRMLSAYAHNSKRMVAEGQQVTAGSQIAEMGTNDRNQAVLHFEIRVNGSPHDPLAYLPRN
jgi:lipoprotein NlpD